MKEKGVQGAQSPGDGHWSFPPHEKKRPPTNRLGAAGPALEAHHRYLKWLIPTLEKFARGQCFLLGDRIETTALDVLERLVEATYHRDRAEALRSANLGLKKKSPTNCRALAQWGKRAG